MNKSGLVLAALAMALAAGSVASAELGKPEQMPGEEWDAGFSIAKFPPPTRCNVKVYVLDDQVVVDQEPALAKSCGSPRATITWSLPSDSVYTFPNNGIRFKGRPLPQRLECRPAPSKKVFVCTFNSPPSGTRYRYSVTVLKGGVALPTLDPTIFAN